MISVMTIIREHAFRLGNFSGVALFLAAMYISSHAQSTPGFLSIDCGSNPGNTPYNDAFTKFNWVSDDMYTLTGTNGDVPFPVNSTLDNYQALQSFRYFPEPRNKHCYKLPTISNNTSFLIRAMFLHGSAPELVRPIQFNVFIDATFWSSIQYDIDDSFDVLETHFILESIFYSSGNVTHLCLVPVEGVPFISSLELRQLNPNGLMYRFPGSTAFFLSTLRRWNCGAPLGLRTVRYPDDSFDRLWYTLGEWASTEPNYSGTTSDITTGSNVNNVPPAVMQYAWKNNTPDSSIFANSLNLPNTVTEVYIAVYIEEIDPVAAHSNVRGVNVSFNGDQDSIHFVNATSLIDMRYYWNWPVLTESINFTFTAQPWSALGPIVNAIEIYAQYDWNFSTTSAQDVKAMEDVMLSFSLTNWQGDPCYPVPLDWVACTSNSSSGRVTKLLLSNYGINGTIPQSISQLDALTEIHLDNNNLTGQIPNSLGQLEHLTVLLLNSNDLSGQVPSDLLSIPGLVLNCSDNMLLNQPSPQSATSTSLSKKGNSISAGVVIGAVAGGVLALGILLGIFIWYFCLKKKKNKPNYHEKTNTITQERHKVGSYPSKVSRQPPFAESAREVGYVSLDKVVIATDNFKEKIGHGAYGAVYRGVLDNRDVAVKKNNIQSSQGHDEFITEVDILTRVHHKNLVSLIGYCNDGNELILIYEFQVNGTLREWLYDDASKLLRGKLDWPERLEIAAGSARGLEYLHKGCNPTIIHRDFKSSNILLDGSRMAKVADFGLCKAAPFENSLGYSTNVKGTPGYLDPEYHSLGRLTHKSDVFSFGVVLAELITGRPPVSRDGDNGTFSLIAWIKNLVATNDLQELADPSLNGNFDSESMWSVVELALSCVETEGILRPDFTQIVRRLGEAKELDARRESSSYNYSPLMIEQTRPLSMMYSDNPYQNIS